MPKREFAPEAKALLRMAQRADTPLALIERLDAMSGDERSAAIRVYAEWGGELNWRLKSANRFEQAMVFALFLDGDVVDVLVGLDRGSLGRLLEDDRAARRVVAAVVGKDRSWAQQFVIGILQDTGWADLAYPLALAAMEAHGLPRPATDAYWLGHLGRPDEDTPDAWYAHITRRLAELPSGERAASSAALLRMLTDRKRPRGRMRLGGWAVPMAAALGATPRGMETVLQRPQPGAEPYVLDEAQEEATVNACRVRGKRWSAEVVHEILNSPRSVASLALIDAVLNLYDLPLPWEDSYWQRWLDVNPVPTPGSRWQERFLLACEVCALRPKTPGIAEAAARMRAVEPTDDRQLLDGLLQVMERSGRPGTQRAAADWIVGLGLVPLIPSEKPRVIRLLATVDAPVAKLLSDALHAEEPHPGDCVDDLARRTRPPAATFGRRGYRPAARRGLVEYREEM